MEHAFAKKEAKRELARMAKEDKIALKEAKKAIDCKDRETEAILKEVMIAQSRAKFLEKYKPEPKILFQFLPEAKFMLETVTANILADREKIEKRNVKRVLFLDC